MKKLLKSILATTMAVATLSTGMMSTKADTIISSDDSKIYKNITILGDSICLGFSVDYMADNTFDIISNAEENKYPTSYPSVLAEKLGLSPTANLRNIGVCAAWSSDMYELINDPTFEYSTISYSYDSYDGTEQFMMPEDVTLTEKQLKDNKIVLADSSTTLEANPKENETDETTYTIKKGTMIMLTYEWNWYGYTYHTLIPYITDHYYLVGKNAYDSNGNIKDFNGDGQGNCFDLAEGGYYYDAKYDWSKWAYVADTTNKDVDVLGEAVRNLALRKTNEFKYINDNIANSDLILVAVGGNDIFHTLLPYCSESDNQLVQLFYTLAYGLMMNSDIDSMIEGGAFDQFLGTSENAAAVLTGDNPTLTGTNNVDENVTSAMSSSIFSAENIKGFIEYFSEENINKYFSDNEVVSNYEKSMDSIIKCIKEKNPNATIGVVSNYNAIGVKNYLNMLSLAFQNGQLNDHLSNDGQVLMTLFQSLIGTTSQVNSLQNMSDLQLSSAANTVDSQIGNILSQLTTAEIDNDALSTCLQDLSYPLITTVLGQNMESLYTDLNNVLIDKCNKYGATYIDITDAPANSKADPHPTEYGNQWIANKIYKTIVPTVTSKVTNKLNANGSVTLTSTSNSSFTDENNTTIQTRLNSTVTCTFNKSQGSYISQIIVDGKSLGATELLNAIKTNSYTFNNVTKSHTINVIYDYSGVSRTTTNVYRASSLNTMVSAYNRVLATRVSFIPSFFSWKKTFTFINPYSKRR